MFERTWFNAMLPVAGKFGPIEMPPVDQKYVRGAGNAQVPDVTGLSRQQAVSRLQDAGFSVTELNVKGEARAGTVINSAPSGSAVPGSTITLYISDGTVRAAPTTTATPARPSGSQVPDTTAPSSPAPIPGRSPEPPESESESPTSGDSEAGDN